MLPFIRFIPMDPSMYVLEDYQGWLTSLHHDDSVGGCTSNEYIDVRGTENAYDSGL